MVSARREPVPTARTLPAMLDAAPARQRNVIVRPHGAGVTFIQLDDLKAEALARLAPAVFLILETSPGNFQAWLAMRGPEDKDFARRVRKGTGADATASGATRVAGSLNFKDKYAPDFPRVAIRQAHAGPHDERRRARAARPGGAAGGVARRCASPCPPAIRPGGNRQWPSYARCVDGAPLNSEETGPDLSRADFVWCMTAITWGWGVDETADAADGGKRKAQANGSGYAELTARNAALAVERRRRPAGRQKPAEHGRR